MPFDKLAIIPAYNEAESIKQVIDGLKEDCDVLVIDDGSTDKTRHIALESGALCISKSFNSGYQEALRTAIEFFKNEPKYDAFVTIDADGEICPADAKKILFSLDIDCRVICGYRYQLKGRMVERGVAYLSNKLFGIRDLYCGCKGVHRMVLEACAVEDIVKYNYTAFFADYARRQIVANLPVGGTRRSGQSRFGSGVQISIKLFINFLKVVSHVYIR